MFTIFNFLQILFTIFKFERVLSLSSIFNDWFVIDGYYWNNSSRCIYWTARSMERSIFYIYSEKLSLFFIYFQYLFNACQCLIKVCGEFLVFIDSTSYRQPIPNQELDRVFWPDFKVNFQIQKNPNQGINLTVADKEESIAEVG